MGNWFCKPTEFPNGLKPVSDACHRTWACSSWSGSSPNASDSNRRSPGSTRSSSSGEHNDLFKLNDPTARRWLTDLLLQRITEYGIDIYRNDFNIDPLHAWRKYDAPDRQGMTEIRYVEGLYEMWDELRAKNPGC